MASGEGPKRPAPSSIQVDDDVGRTPSGIAIDDAPSAGIAIDDPLSSGIALDDGRDKEQGRCPVGVLGDPMKLGFAEAKQIARQELDTAKVLGLDAKLLREGKISTQAVSAQLSLFLERLKKMEEKDKALQRAASEEPAYGTWLGSIRRLRGDTATGELRAIVESEAINVALVALRADARVHLSDGHLEWAEHQKMLWRAAQLSLTPEHVEQVYREFLPFTRETEEDEAAERKVQVLQAAEKILLTADVETRRRLVDVSASKLPTTTSVAQPILATNPETAARVIELITSASGTKVQERRGTVLYRRASLFYRGVEYGVEELIHKKYESSRDRKRYTATGGGVLLFEYIISAGNSERDQAGVFLDGPWLVDLNSFAAHAASSNQ